MAAVKLVLMMAEKAFRDLQQMGEWDAVIQTVPGQVTLLWWNSPPPSMMTTRGSFLGQTLEIVSIVGNQDADCLNAPLARTMQGSTLTERKCHRRKSKTSA